MINLVLRWEGQITGLFLAIFSASREVPKSFFKFLKDFAWVMNFGFYLDF